MHVFTYSTPLPFLGQITHLSSLFRISTLQLRPYNNRHNTTQPKPIPPTFNVRTKHVFADSPAAASSSLLVGQLTRLPFHSGLRRYATSSTSCLKLIFFTVVGLEAPLSSFLEGAVYKFYK